MKQITPDYPMKTENNLILSRVIAPRKDDEHLLNMALIGYVCDENDHPLHAVSIDCEPPLLGIPYFKLYSTANRRRARCVARICFTEAKVVVPVGGKPLMKLTKRMCRALMHFFQSPDPNNFGDTYWQSAIVRYNIENGGDVGHWRFCELTADAIARDPDPEKYAFCLPYDLPMPDYSALASVSVEAARAHQGTGKGILYDYPYLDFLRGADGALQYCITLDRERARAGEPAFLVYNSPSQAEATACACLSMLEAKVLPHGSLPPMEVSSELGARLNAFWQARARHTRHLTAWQDIINWYNRFQEEAYYQDKGDEEEDDDDDICFGELTQEEIESDPITYARCLPLSLPMPDYTNLREKQG